MPAETHTDERKLVREHFRGTLHGTYTTLQYILDSERKMVIYQAEQNASIVKNANDIPTKCYVV